MCSDPCWNTGHCTHVWEFPKKASISVITIITIIAYKGLYQACFFLETPTLCLAANVCSAAIEAPSPESNVNSKILHRRV